MKKLIFTISILLLSLTAFAQTDSLAIQELQHKVKQVQTELKNQKSDFSNQVKTVNDDIAELRSEVETEKAVGVALADSLGVKISDTRTSAEQQIAKVDKSLGKTTLWAIIGILFAIIVSGTAYLLLRKKQQSDKTDIAAKLNQTKQAIDEKLVEKFAKQTKALEEISQKQQSNKMDIAAQLNQTKQAIDEKLVEEFAKQTKKLEEISKKLLDLQNIMALQSTKHDQ